MKPIFVEVEEHEKKGEKHAKFEEKKKVPIIISHSAAASAASVTGKQGEDRIPSLEE